MTYGIFEKNKLEFQDFLGFAKNQDCETAVEKTRDCKMHIATKKQDCESCEIFQKVCENRMWFLKDHSLPH